MKVNRFSFLSILPLLIALILSGCSNPSAQAAPTTIPAASTEIVKPVAPSSTPPAPAATALPTGTTVPTQTIEPTVSPTQLPAGVFFRDDFTKDLQPGWTWKDENKERWTITQDGWLQILADDPYLFFDNSQANVLFRDLPDGDFDVIIHATANPTEPNQNIQIILYQDNKNYMEINRGFCGPCQNPGSGFFMDFEIAGSRSFYEKLSKATDFYLKLRSQNKVLSGYYALEPEKWILLGKLGNYYQFKRVGIGATNSDPEHKINSDLVARIDFVEIRKPK